MATTLAELLVNSMSAHAKEHAVIDRGRAYSYAELDEASARLAGGLLSRGVGVGDLVCLYSNRSWWRCVAVLGAWRVGVGVVSIDPAQPWVRTLRILRAASPKLLMHETGGEPPDAGVPAVAYGKLALDHRTARDVSDGPVCYAIATSGSTGEPKSVALPPVVLANLGTWHLEHWQYETAPRTLHAAPVGFDVGYEEMVAAFLAGTPLVIAREDQRRDPFELAELIRTYRLARIFQPVGGLHALAVAGVCEQPLSSLREILVAGEQLVINDEVRALCAANRLELVNQYGPSETHVVTQHRLTGDPWSWPDRPPIGAPVVGAQLLCSDAAGNGDRGDAVREFVPGEEAELVIAGDCVGLGYVGDGEASARRFPVRRHRNGGLYRCYLTGDLVRKEDGVFRFLGRVDDQVKINGYRVEPVEIETMLGHLPGLRRATVIDYRKRDSIQLAAFYVREPGSDLTAAAMRAACADALPDYMVPRRFHELSGFPLNRNGKIDRFALRDLLEGRPDPDRADAVAGEGGGTADGAGD